MSEILEQRKKRMLENGIPLPITQVNESVATNSIPVTNANADKHARLAALKSGANRSMIKDLVASKGKQNSFEPIPEVKQRRNPQPVGKENSVPLQTFQPKSDPQLSAIESMFDGGSASSQINLNPVAPTGTQPELSVQQDGYGPAFDPAAMLAEKKAKLQNSEYLKYAVNKDAQPQSVQDVVGTDQQSFDFQNMKKMMEEIAKRTISEVLNDYTEKNKNKLVYENYTKTKDGAQVIKTQDGKFFKLTPVKLKKG